MWDRETRTVTIGVSSTDGFFVGGTPSLVVIPVGKTFLTPLAEYSSDLKDRWAMLSQFIRIENDHQASFSHFGPRDISVLIELTLGHLRYHLTDVPPQPNSQT